jgi:hypothetical protein
VAESRNGSAPKERPPRRMWIAAVLLGLAAVGLAVTVFLRLEARTNAVAEIGALGVPVFGPRPAQVTARIPVGPGLSGFVNSALSARASC